MIDDSDDELNMDLLARAAENEDNAHILNLTADAVAAAKTSILHEMHGYIYIIECSTV